MIYQRMIDNALWGFVQPKGGWRCFAEKIKQVHSAEHSTKSWGESPIVNTKFAAARSDVENHDPVLKLVNEPTSDMLATNEVDESALVPVFDGRSFVDDICLGERPLTTASQLLIDPWPDSQNAAPASASPKVYSSNNELNSSLTKFRTKGFELMQKS
ncbi:hypothetical protein PHMEG_00025897 [Phytophthora megakarya]|uniref:Uncharacterized protein n=1 Tax=Phytophthora megakarya TaxID=4795 RepID=A0A225VCD3_9STRA|nr:hypothetical protein PHMEG_00025897 [Phytophthora megakarya]